MKRTLLFSATMLAVAGMSVNAQVAVQPINANLQSSAQKVVNTLNKNVKKQSNKSKLPINNLKSCRKKEQSNKDNLMKIKAN